jgi:hypothetical protein
MKNEDGLLDDLAPKRKARVFKKRFYSNKGVSVETAARRQAAAEAAAENPLPKDQKDAILMKFGVKPAVVERNIKMPFWKADTIFQLSERKTEVVWDHRMQDWYKETKNMIPQQQRSQRSNSGRGYTTSRPARNLSATKVTPYPKDQDRYTRNPRQFPILRNNKPSSVPMEKSTKSQQN